LREALIPIIAISGDNDISAIFKSTPSEEVPPEQLRELLKLLPALLCSACAAGSVSSNTRYPTCPPVFVCIVRNLFVQKAKDFSEMSRVIILANFFDSSLTLACAQLLLLTCNCAPTPAALLAQLQPGVISALAFFLSHSSMPVCALSAATCQLIVKRCQADGAQLLHNIGIPGEIQDSVERWRACRRDGSLGADASICDKLLSILEGALQNINVLCDGCSSSPQDVSAVVQQLRKSGQHVDFQRLRSLFIGPHALSALQLLKSGLPLALSQFLCAENDFPRPSAQHQSSRLLWFFQQLCSCSVSPDGMGDISDRGIDSEICRVFLSEIVVLLIDAISSKEQVLALFSP
jgi:hypothetical protein